MLFKAEIKLNLKNLLQRDICLVVEKNPNQEIYSFLLMLLYLM